MGWTALGPGPVPGIGLSISTQWSHFILTLVLQGHYYDPNFQMRKLRPGKSKWDHHCIFLSLLGWNRLMVKCSA